MSFVAAAEPDAQAEVLADVEAVLRTDPDTAGRDVIDLPYDTEVMWARRRTIAPGLSGVVVSFARWKRRGPRRREAGIRRP